jgi:hypothetical protein
VVTGLVMSLVVVMPEICGCGLVPTGLVWLTKQFGALLEMPIVSLQQRKRGEGQG